ncbi:hypothetical protein BGZ76_010776 [Entomortierella beljakovae]|nr:hypothetical protein BGZ76_010776 [Entomortierella beljakovae]
MCILDGDPSAFEVTLDADDSIAALKKAIKGEKPNDLKEIDADKLILYKVSIPMGDDNDDQNEQPVYLKDHRSNAKKIGAMKAGTRISVVFGTDPPENTIHVILQRPSAFLDVIENAVANYGGLSPINQKRTMPLKDRDFGDAIDLISSNVRNNLSGSDSKADYHMVVSAGAPGIGKTRFGKELFSHLKDNWITPSNEQPRRWRTENIRFHYIHLDFGNGIKLDDEDNDISNPSVIIGLRIAYCHFIQGKYKPSFETFRQLVGAHIHLFNISNVLESIQQDLGYSDELQLFIFLHIDEFQLLDQWDDTNKKQGKLDISLFKNAINSLAAFMMSNSPIFVQTFLSGTTPRIIISAKETSRASFGFVSCPLLSFRAMFEIAEYFAETFNAERFVYGAFKWTLCQHFLQLLEDTGGLPRAMELLFQECFKLSQGGEAFFSNIKSWNFEAIFANIKVGLENRYKLYDSAGVDKPLILTLVRHSISGKPVMRSTMLDPDDERSSIESLECDSHIILDPVSGSNREFTIRMPFFFICLYNDTLRVVDCKLEDAFRIHYDMHWQDWELFVAHFEAFRNNLLIELGTRETTLSELYHNVKGTEATMSTVVHLQKLSVRRAREQFPSLILTDKEGKPIEWDKGDSVIVNGASAPWGGAFVTRQTQNENLLFQHQDKFDYKSVKFTAEELIQEHIKNISGSLDAKGGLRRKLASYRHITIVFTTQPFDDEVTVDGCLIISRDTILVQFFLHVQHLH